MDFVQNILKGLFRKQKLKVARVISKKTGLSDAQSSSVVTILEMIALGFIANKLKKMLTQPEPKKIVSAKSLKNKI